MTQPLTSHATKSLALLAAVMIPVAAVAQTATFNFIDGSEGATSFVSNVNGITMTVSNFTGGGANFYEEGDFVGILLSPSSNWATGFQFSFDHPVRLTGYTMGQLSSENGTFDLTGGSAGDALGNPLTTAYASVDLTGANYTLNAGQIGTLTGNFSNPNDYGILASFTVAAIAIPEPGSWALMAGACGSVIAIGLRRWRRRREA